MSIKLTSAETGRNRSSLAAAVGSSDRIDIASFTSTYIKNTPTGWANVSSGSFDTTYAAAIAAGVQITNIYVTDSNWNILDDTAISTSGGYLKILGAGFQSGCVVYIQGTAASSVSFVNSSELRVIVPAISSGTLQVYVVNPNNSVAIRISGIVASGVPSWVTTSPLADTLTDIAFSYQLSATSDSTIAYSLQAGSSLPSGTSLSSSGLFSGTVTGISTATAYSFTVVATDLEYQDTAKIFTITVSVGDVYFPVTTLLLSAQSNTWISDASTSNNGILTIGGDTKPIGFSPYNYNWSNYFDGSDYLTVTGDSNFAFGTGDFTIEGFVYFTSVSVESTIYDSRASGVSSGPQPCLIMNGTSSKLLNYYVSGATRISSDAVMAVNQWYHIAICRVSSVTRMFINGKQQTGTYADTTNYTNGTTRPAIGAYGDNLTGGNITGYISNIRAVKGVGVYTGNFTVPTTHLTATQSSSTNIAAISGTSTSLLTCQSNRLIDKSTANNGSGFTISKGGDVLPKSFGPFVETDLITGSAYFDGTGDYLTFADNANLELGSGDFCVECWFYPTSVGATGVIIDKRSGSYGPLLLWRSASTLVVYMSSNGSSWDMVNGSIITTPILDSAVLVNHWYHVAIYRVSGVIYGSVNGTVSVLNASNTSTPINNAGNWFIGTETNGSSNPYTGYISNLRFVVGSGVYTSSNFTPPTTPLTAVTNTKLLTLQNRKGENNNRFVDESTSKSLITRSGNTSQGSFSSYSPSGWSAYFDGTGDYLSFPSNAIFGFGTGDFTIEFWAYPSTLTPRQFFYDGVTTDPSVTIQISTDSNGVLTYYVNGSVRIQQTGSAITTNTWHHIAVSRVSGSTRMYLDGTQVGSTYTDTNSYITSPLIVMHNYNLSTGSIGYLSNLRVIKGTGLYTGSTITVPTTALTAVTNTVLLTLQNNHFKDNSTANNGSGFTVTNNGYASIRAFSPFRGSGAYTPSIHGGSAYFDGNADYLSVTNSPQLTLNGDHSIEFWMYPDGPQNRYSCPWFYTSSGTYYFSNPSDSGGSMSLLVGPYSGSAWPVQITISATDYNQSLNNWSHIVVTRSSTAFRVFINGVLKGYATSSQSIGAQSSTFNIGWDGTNATTYYKGWLSNFRIVNGSIPTTYQTANTTIGTRIFNPLTSVTSYEANTVLQVDFTNGAIVDDSGRNVIETVGIPRANNAVNHWSKSTISFPSALTSYLLTTNKPELDFGTGDFTVECWVYFNSVSADQGLFGGGNTNAWDIRWRTTTGLNLGRINTAFDSTFAWSPSVGTWYHVAVTRSGTSVRAFINGTQIGSTSTNSNTYNSGIPFYIGLTDTANSPLNGYLDDIRITKGYARYTANFTSPTQPFSVR